MSWSELERSVIDQHAFVQEVASLLTADMKTSGTRTEAEIREAFRISLTSLVGDDEVPAQFAFVLAVGAERWPTIIVTSHE